MRFILIFGALVVFVCNIIVSFNHTLALYRSFGVRDGLEYFSVAGAETAFLCGVLYIVVARIKGKPIGRPAKTLMFLGVGLVTWSNVAALYKYGIGGIILGVLTPAFLVVVESLLAVEFTRRHRETGETVAQKTQTDNKPVTHFAQPEEVAQSVTQPMGDNDEKNAQPVAQHSTHFAQCVQPGEPKEITQPGDKPEAQPDKSTQTAGESAQVMGEENAQTDEPVQPEETAHFNHIAQKAKTVDIAQYRPKNRPNRPSNPTTPYEWAKHLYEQTGKPPSRRKLAEVAGCTEYAARQALAELKERIS